MNSARCDIIPYSEEFNYHLLRFEKGIVQGGQIQLEIVKEHFLSRAAVFTDFQAFVAVDAQKNVIGTAIGAKTTIEINEEQRQAGFGFDAKVSADHRNKGLGRKLAGEMYRQFFKPNGLSENYMTAKLNNAAVLKMISGILSSIWIYDFTYLTIPSSARMEPGAFSTSDNFGVRLFDSQNVAGPYCTLFENGLGYFHSYKMYQLKIKKVKFAYRAGLWFLKKYDPVRYQNMPGEGGLMSFATLYNHSVQNLNSLNLVLEDLERRDIGFLLVCCKKGGAVYKSLNNISINSYDYHIVADFPLKDTDCVNIDVRCL